MRRRQLVQCTDGWKVPPFRTTATPGARGKRSLTPRPLLTRSQPCWMRTRMMLMRLHLRLNSFCWVLLWTVGLWSNRSLSGLPTQIKCLSLWHLGLLRTAALPKKLTNWPRGSLVGPRPKLKHNQKFLLRLADRRNKILARHFLTCLNTTRDNSGLMPMRALILTLLCHPRCLHNFLRVCILTRLLALRLPHRCPYMGSNRSLGRSWQRCFRDLGGRHRVACAQYPPRSLNTCLGRLWYHWLPS